MNTTEARHWSRSRLAALAFAAGWLALCALPLMAAHGFSGERMAGLPLAEAVLAIVVPLALIALAAGICHWQNRIDEAHDMAEDG